RGATPDDHPALRHGDDRVGLGVATRQADRRAIKGTDGRVTRRERELLVLQLQIGHSERKLPHRREPRQARRGELHVAAASSPTCRRYRRAYRPLASSRLRCVPRSRTSPWCNTRISVARVIVLSRCATAIVVRPCISTSSPCWICASTSLSTLLVASSSSSSAGSAAIARAKLSNCRSPTLSELPRSPRRCA